MSIGGVLACFACDLLRVFVVLKFEVYMIDDMSPNVEPRHYAGVYALKEKIQRGTNRLNITKQASPSPPPFPFPDAGAGAEAEGGRGGHDVSGGYLVQLSSNSHDGMLSTGEPQKEKLRDEGPSRVSFVYPKKPSDEQKAYFASYLDAFQQALWSDHFADPNHGYARYIDVDSFIDYWVSDDGACVRACVLACVRACGWASTVMLRCHVPVPPFRPPFPPPFLPAFILSSLLFHSLLSC